jgi:6-pyruvoyltetrahydropterin/6-carboxytetrahydropterin synthase
VILTNKFSFESSHLLPHHPGKCRFLHGHSYKLRVALWTKMDPRTGMGCDFDDLAKVVQEQVLEQADHHNLNDFIDNPTAENICLWIWDRLADQVPGRLVEIELHETDDCSCIYRGPEAVTMETTS